MLWLWPHSMQHTIRGPPWDGAVVVREFAVAGEDVVGLFVAHMLMPANAAAGLMTSRAYSVPWPIISSSDRMWWNSTERGRPGR
jgi:hypothetical protein